MMMFATLDRTIADASALPNQGSVCASKNLKVPDPPTPSASCRPTLAEGGDVAGRKFTTTIHPAPSAVGATRTLLRLLRKENREVKN